MNHQPDKLFREKLLRHQATVPENAWKQLFHALHPPLIEKTRSFPWLRVAAVIMPIGVALWLMSGKEQAPAFVPDLHGANTREAEAINEIEVVQPASTEEEYRRRVTPLLQEPLPIQMDPVTTVHSPEVETEIPIDITLDPQIPVITENATREGTPQEEEGVTIIYTLAESKKFLEGESDADATAAADKSSTLQKLRDLAFDLKYDTDPVGELRQIKYDLLARNARGE